MRRYSIASLCICMGMMSLFAIGCGHPASRSKNPITIYFLSRDVSSGEMLMKDMLEPHLDAQQLFAMSPGKTLSIDKYVTERELPNYLGQKFLRNVNLGEPLLKMLLEQPGISETNRGDVQKVDAEQDQAP